jgi:Ino eighty subunit 1
MVVFPEMRAQLRTYHPIPSLQSGQEQNAKLLQDAPRIKSILKGVQEDRNEPFTWEQLLECRKRGLKPLTSPVSLIFLFGTYCQKMTELHFAPPREFYDLFNKTNLSSESRANSFLWLCWHYLETDGTPDAAVLNPFGKPDTEGTVHVPVMTHLTDEQEKLENIDPEEEIEYGKRMGEERKRKNV